MKLRVILVVGLLLLPGAALAQIGDPEGDADIPCIDMVSLDVRGDAAQLTVSLQTSMRPYPPGYVVEGVDLNDVRLCPDGRYDFRIDTNADGTSDQTLSTVINRRGQPTTTGPEGTVAQVDVRAGRIVWSVPNASLGLPSLPAEVRVLVESRIVPSRGSVALLPNSGAPPRTQDIAPKSWTDFTVGAAAAVLLGPDGGRVEVTDASSALFGTSLEVPAGALVNPMSVSLRETSQPPSLPGDAVPASPFVVVRPAGVQLTKPATLRLPLLDPQSDAPLTVWNFDEPSAEWSVLDFVDLTEHYVWSALDSFSTKVATTSPLGLLRDGAALSLLAAPNVFTYARDQQSAELQEEMTCKIVAPNGVSLLLLNAGDIESDGQIQLLKECYGPDPKAEKCKWLQDLASYTASVLDADGQPKKVLFWLNATKEGRAESILSDSDHRAELASSVWEFLNEIVRQQPSLARGERREQLGILYDIEPVPNGILGLFPDRVDDLVQLLELTQEELRTGFANSPVAVFTMKTRAAWYSNPFDKWVWTRSAFAEVSEAADLLFYGAYDYRDSVKSYRAYSSRVASDLSSLPFAVASKTVALISVDYFTTNHTNFERADYGVEGVRASSNVQRLLGAGFYQAYGETLDNFGADFFRPSNNPPLQSEDQFHAAGGGDPLPEDWVNLKLAFTHVRTWSCNSGSQNWDDVVWALNGDIVTSKFDGSGRRVVVSGNGYSLDTPMISPNGRKLAYRKYPPAPITSEQICVLDGSTTKCATIPQSGGPGNNIGFTYDYTWDHQSRKIYFTRNEQWGGGEIWVVDFDAANPTEQFFLRPGVSRTFGISTSRDGQKMVMVHDPGFWTYNNFIAVYDFTTGQSTTIYSSNGRRDFWASYSPTADEFVWIQMDSSDQGDVWRMNADGTGAINLTPGTPGTAQFAAGDQLWPRFSPDGSQVFWAENGKLWVMNRDGSDKHSLMDLQSSPGYEWRFDVARNAPGSN